MSKVKEGMYSRNSFFIALFASLFYLLFSWFLIGVRTDQLVLTAIFDICFFLSPVSRKFIIGFSIFVVYWILFDYMKAFPNYTFNTVHIQDLYNAEKSFFGIAYQDSIITPNEYWLQNGRSWLDIMAGIFYLCWIPVPLALAAFLFFKDKELFLHFSLTFVLVITPTPLPLPGIINCVAPILFPIPLAIQPGFISLMNILISAYFTVCMKKVPTYLQPCHRCTHLIR